MADASCSGTTPFKQLIDHQTRDVSHHQDRLVGPQQPGAQGSFRSAAAPSQGQQNFAAFMNGGSAMPHDPAGRLHAHAAALDPVLAPRFHSPGLAHTPPPQLSGQSTPNMSSWAADFSRFSQQQGAPVAPLQNGYGQPGPAFQQNQASQIPQYQGFQNAFSPQVVGAAPLYGPTNRGFMDPAAAAAQRPAAEADFDQEMSRWMAVNGGGGDMKDVDAAMDQMARELELNDAALVEAERAAAQEASGALQTDDAHFTDLETPEIGNLSLEPRQAPEEAEMTDQQEPKARSAVAEAAEQLLDTVQHEQGEKWQNSVFLSLMRDFRDGRKDIVDGEIHETTEAAERSPTASEGGKLVTDFQKYHPYALHMTEHALNA